MDLRKPNGITVIDSNSIDTSDLQNDDINVRSKGMNVVTNPRHLSGGKSLLVSEARVVSPSDDEEMRRLQSQFANLNPKSPLSPPNLQVETDETGQYRMYDRLDGKPKLGRARGVTLDARCDPKAMPKVTTMAYHPTDSHSPTQVQESRIPPMFMHGADTNPQPSQVQVVSPQTPTPKITIDQLQQLVRNNNEPWKKDLIEKIVRNFHKAKRITPVSPEADIENSFEQKEMQLNMKVVPEEPEDMTITISDDDPFVDIRKESTNPVPEPRMLSCQPSDTISGNSMFQPEQLNESTYLRPHTFLKGHILPGTAESLTNLLKFYSMNSAELAIGCHGILTTQNNRSTELGEYEEDEEVLKGHSFIRHAGKGSYGVVKMCRDNFTKMEFVKKEIYKTDKAILYEVKTLSELKHVNVTELYGFILRNGIPEILMEFAGVSMLQYATDASTRDDLGEEGIIDITYQGLSGLEYLANKRIIHYDIKPENLCILKKENRRILKITDFGSAKKETEPPDFMGCTVEYMSPELGIQLILSKYQSGIQMSHDASAFVVTTKSDIFSFAMSVIFMYRKGHAIISLFNDGKMTYNGLAEAIITRLRQTILVSLVKNPAMVKLMLIPDDCCSGMKSILREMTEEYPDKRPTASQLKETMDDVFNRRKIPPEVPEFVTRQSYIADKHRSMIRQTVTRNSRSGGPVRNHVSYNRRMSNEQGSHPYGWTRSQRMDTNVTDVEVVEQLQGIVPNFDQL